MFIIAKPIGVVLVRKMPLESNTFGRRILVLFQNPCIQIGLSKQDSLELDPQSRTNQY